jgi:hypothetical protein
MWLFRLTEWGEVVELGPGKLEVWFYIPLQCQYPEDCYVIDTCCRSLKMCIIPLLFVSRCMLKEVQRKLISDYSSFVPVVWLALQHCLVSLMHKWTSEAQRTWSEIMCAPLKYTFLFFYFLVFLTLEDGTDRLFENTGTLTTTQCCVISQKNADLLPVLLLIVTVLELPYHRDLISIFTTATIYCEVRNYIQDLNIFLCVSEYVFCDLYLWLAVDFILFF